MEFLKHNEQSFDVLLSPSDVESAIRQFICTCKPEYAKNWILNPKYNLGAALFAATKGDEVVADNSISSLKQAVLDFGEVVKPLMKFLAENHHPHVTVIVTSTDAELVEGLKTFRTQEFIKD